MAENNMNQSGRDSQGQFRKGSDEARRAGQKGGQSNRQQNNNQSSSENR